MKWSIFPCLTVIATLFFPVNASAQATYHAFIWSANTGMQDLGSLGGSSYAQGINASGQVVGYYVSLLGQLRPFLWTQSGGIKDLGTLGGDAGVAAGINDSGQVAGWATTAAGAAHAFLWSAAGGMKDLGTLF
jgi:probable HAF family extracellular repeat protein